MALIFHPFLLAIPSHLLQGAKPRGMSITCTVELNLSLSLYSTVMEAEAWYKKRMSTWGAVMRPGSVNQQPDDPPGIWVNAAKIMKAT